MGGVGYLLCSIVRATARALVVFYGKRNSRNGATIIAEYIHLPSPELLRDLKQLAVVRHTYMQQGGGQWSRQEWQHTCEG